MKYKPLGRTGLFVSELCLGTMTFGGSDDGSIQSKIGQLQQEESERIVGSSLDAGINFIDTADIYADGRSEEIIGQALRNLKVPRESVVVATKVFNETGPGANCVVQREPHHRRSAGEPEAPAARRRHLRHPRLRSGDADRGNGACARHHGAARPCALRRRFELGGLADHEGARHFRAARPWRASRACRPITRSPAATSSAS